MLYDDGSREYDHPTAKAAGPDLDATTPSADEVLEGAGAHDGLPASGDDADLAGPLGEQDEPVRAHAAGAPWAAAHEPARGAGRRVRVQHDRDRRPDGAARPRGAGPG